MKQKLTKELIEYFEEYVTLHKQQLISTILSKRTRHLTVVLEDIFKPHNASAVIRTCECLGIQDLHVIEQVNSYAPNPYVTRGATKWMSLYNYSDSASCLASLKDKGYRIAVTTPDENAISYKEFDLSKPFAMVFGTEFTGVSDAVKEQADEFIYIPMVGFTESLNISVSAAILLEEFSSRLRETDVKWELTSEEKTELTLIWYKNIVKRSELLEQRFLSEKN